MTIYKKPPKQKKEIYLYFKPMNDKSFEMEIALICFSLEIIKNIDVTLILLN